MELSLKAYIIICPLVFLGGFVDAIGGGGGLITLPAYMLAGLPAHLAIATNKLSSTGGTFVSALRFIRERLVSFRIAVPAVFCAFAGSFIGARLSLLASERYLKAIMIPALAAAAFFVLNKNMFGKTYPQEEGLSKRVYIVACAAAFAVGMYDGFYGPGTGTFLIIALNVFAHMNIKAANAQTKILNLTTNFTSLCVFIVNGQIVWKLGLAAMVCGIAGNYIGSSLALRKGDKITRPVILVVLGLLFMKVILDK